MSITINSNVLITSNWTNFKEIAYITKNLPIQYDDDGEMYSIFTFDGGSIAYQCIIWKALVPNGISDGGYTQEQNDNDKYDFETNYKSQSNKSIIKLSATGVAGYAAAKGLGGFAPSPTNNPYEPDPDELVSLYADGEGSLMTRGAVLTDEGSMRDDFTGNSLYTNLTGTLNFTNGSNLVSGTDTLFTSELSRDFYIKLDGYNDYYKVVRAPTDTSVYISEPFGSETISSSAKKTRWIELNAGTSPGNVSVSSSKVAISSGTSNDCSTILHREGDYLPLLSTWILSVSQRIENQTIFFGLRDGYDDPNMYCDILLTGTDNKKITFRSAWNKDEQLSEISLPSGLNTSQSLRYKIDVSTDYCALLINGVLVVRHDNHVPDPYIDLELCCGIVNSADVSNTNVAIDTVFFSNQDQVQISSAFVSPIPIITKEDQHTLIGKLITSSTDENQVIISHTVPNDRVLYVIGYRIENEGDLDASVLKIGKNDISSEPSSPGLIDNSLFRVFSLDSRSSTGEVDFGANPRKLGVGGDVIKVAVSPSGNLRSIWHVAIDFVLR